MEALRLEDLTFAYGRRVVLADINMSIMAGEMWGVIGPNGSGKSTLIRGISGVVSPSRGRITLMGEDISRLSRSYLARKVAIVPQNPNLPEAFTVLDVVLMGRTPHLRLLQTEGPKDMAAVKQAMETTNTWELAGARIGELSGGERQRVVIARALAQEPQLLLLDEPTAHLDICHQGAVLDLIKDLNQKQGLTVLAVFHDLNLAAMYCERVCVLAKRRLFCQGDIREVITTRNIEAAYGVRVCVLPHPVNGLPATLLAPVDGHPG